MDTRENTPAHNTLRLGRGSTKGRCPVSHEATRWANAQRGLKPATKVVLLQLCDHFNPKHGCFPSQAHLAESCGMSRRTVNAHLNRLEQQGLIRRVQRANPMTKHQMSTLYLFPFQAEFDRKPSAKIAHGGSAKACADSDKSHVQNSHSNPTSESITTTPSAAEQAQAACLAASGPGLSETARIQITSTVKVIEGWHESGYELNADILPVVSDRTARPRSNPIRSWAYFTNAIQRAHQQRLRPTEKTNEAENSNTPFVCATSNFDAVLNQYAEWINKKSYLPPSAITNSIRDGLLARNLVTPDQLREMGVY